MNYNPWIIRIIILAAILIAVRCARQASPTGGPKDETPPVVVESEPPAGTTNFNSSRITVTFDEYVKFDNLNEKLMVSPPLGKKPEISLKGKSMVIRVEEKLKDSTTYTFYFQDAIRDLNEGNPLNNFQYVLATGDVIDSLSVTGNVLNSENLEPGEKILVMLYSNLADTAPVNTLPDYITMADARGGFRINNVKEGIYRLFALADNNNNKYYDLQDELFAFHDSILNIYPAKNWLPEIKDTVIVSEKDTSKTDAEVVDGEYKLFFFTGPKKSYYLTSSSRKMPYQLIYTLSLPPDTMKFDFQPENGNKDSYFIERSKQKDTLTVWITDSLLYSIPTLNTLISYPFTDSTGKNIQRQDTLEMRFIAPKTTRVKPVKAPFRFTTSLSGSGIRPGDRIIISSPTPFRNPDTSKIRLYEVSSKGSLPLKYNLVRDTSRSMICFLDARLREEGKYLFVADSASFGNIYGDVCDSTGIRFEVRAKNSFGHLDLNVSNVQGDLIIQLLDKSEKLISEKKTSKDGIVRFPMLERGNYRLRAIWDLNGDNKWTTGDYGMKIQPEPVSYYPGEIEIKVDWEISNDWDLSLKYIKPENLKSPVKKK
jgi:hypothetical protein